MTMSDTPLLIVEVAADADVFVLRQRARAVAGAVGLDDQDQIRVATALSELGREVLVVGGAEVRFEVLDCHAARMLVITLAVRGPMGDARSGAVAPGVEAAGRLGDILEIDPEGPGTRIRFGKRLPHALRSAPGDDARRVALELHRTAPPTPLEELRAQNRDLLATLEQLELRRAELQALNSELEETNQGVMAMYQQLSKELDETNRGVVALYADLDKKSAEVQRATEAKTRFLANVSHELRSPVNSILGLTDLLLTEPSAPEQGRPEVPLIADCATQLRILVNDLLDLAKAESGRLEPAVGDVDVDAVFAQLRATLRPLVTTPGVKLVIETPTGAPPLRSDGAMLTTVLRNLLTNAIKFTPQGHVELRAALRPSLQHVEFVVADTGIGIPAEEQALVFEEFHQVRGSHQLSTTGTGLGLPYAKRLTDLLGGTLRLESVPGAGSTFTVQVPLRWPHPDPFLDPGELSGLAPVHAGTVLVVDDDPAFRHVLRTLLQGIADRVVEAGDGSEALAELAGLRPDLIFLDLRMPRVDGAAVLEALADDPVLRQVPVLVTTTVELDAASRALSTPFAGFLPKQGLDASKVRQAMAAAMSASNGG